MEMFERLSDNPEYREVLAKDFMPSCVAVATQQIDKPDILKPALVP
jgi:hypothetical protein